MFPFAREGNLCRTMFSPKRNIIYSALLISKSLHPTGRSGREAKRFSSITRTVYNDIPLPFIEPA